jgi:hypothetical protein
VLVRTVKQYLAIPRNPHLALLTAKFGSPTVTGSRFHACDANGLARGSEISGSHLINLQLAAQHQKLSERHTEASMATDEHYFIEENKDGKFAVRAKGSQRASRLCDTQEEAEELVKKFNPNDKPDVERVRNTKSGGRDQWRSE